MVIFVSECEKNALKKTRRVLDAFAERIGNNTWQALVTEEGLNAIKKLLRQASTKSTAVACHWIRSRSRSQFLWIVGNRSKFNEQGIIAVNSTQKNTSLRENTWDCLPLIKALAAIAALLHDWGKASALFQEKLKTSSKLGDPIRHEWVSCLLLSALVKTCDNLREDTQWLAVLINGQINEVELKKNLKQRDKKPLNNLPPAAKLIAWLIVSHHRMPQTNEDEDWRDEVAPNIDSVLCSITQAWGYENRHNEQEYQKRENGCFNFPNGLLNQSSLWLKQLKKWAQRLKDCLPMVSKIFENNTYRLILHHARLSLMLGDHYYSSQSADPHWQDKTGLFANTDRKNKTFKQKLDEHLVFVAKNAVNIVHLLPLLESMPPAAQDVIALKQASSSLFFWQDNAVDKIKNWKTRHTKEQLGFFAVNMASTGCGKTFANAKIMRALSTDGDSLRYILALGLRTLTLQTGDEYRKRVGLDNTELAVLIGSKAVMELHSKKDLAEEVLKNEQVGSESLEPLLDEYVDYEGMIPEEGLATVLKQDKDRQFLYAPILVCTIDHIMAATETIKGGRYILPSLRLMSSDLVIDEIDDFTGSDLIAIGRLIYLAGMLGKKVMISSATIPPDLAEGYFNAYSAGWRLFSETRAASSKIGCLWIDEFKASIKTLECQNTIEIYRNKHQNFVEKRVKKLSQQPARRKANIITCQDIYEQTTDVKAKQKCYFAKIQQTILNQHQNNYLKDNKTNCKVSFGVIRVANIAPCIDLSKYLMKCNWPENVEAKIMAYHSRQVLLLRHTQEKHLDEVLERKENIGEMPNFFNNIIIREHLNNSPAKHVIFILVATPVEEVGRDHDFDWAIIEPSSYRSIIQLAGRVRRHRQGEINNPNIALLQYNWKAIKTGNLTDKKLRKCFLRPGYEIKSTLKTHDLSQLINISTISKKVDAIPRIQKPKKLNPDSSLVDLEHYVIKSELANYECKGPEQLQGYLSGAWHLTALPQRFNPFRKNQKTINLFLTYDEASDGYVFIEKDNQGSPVPREKILGIHHDTRNEHAKNRQWLLRDYEKIVEDYAAQYGLSKKAICLRYGELSLNYRENQEYLYSDQFGMAEI